MISLTNQDERFYCFNCVVKLKVLLLPMHCIPFNIFFLPFKANIVHKPPVRLKSKTTLSVKSLFSTIILRRNAIFSSFLTKCSMVSMILKLFRGPTQNVSQARKNIEFGKMKFKAIFLRIELSRRRLLNTFTYFDAKRKFLCVIF